MTTTCASATREMTKGRSLMALVDGSSALTSLSSLFAAMLEKNVSNLETLCIIHSLASFSCLLLFAWVSVAVACVLLCWFAITVYQCKRIAL